MQTTEAKINFAHRIETAQSFDRTVEQVTRLLAEEGFGVLTEIDVQATMKKKLDLDYKPFRILGACNPPFAHRTLQAEPLISVLLPCNVVVWDEGEKRVVAAMDATVMGRILDNPEVIEVARAVDEKLRRVLEKVSSAD